MPKELLKIWDLLPCPSKIPKIRVNLDRMNYFDVSKDWLEKRSKGLLFEIDTIFSLNECNNITKLEKIKSSRYLPSLRQIPTKQRTELYELLSLYKSFLVK